MANKYVVYHKSCRDGLAAAWSAEQVFGDGATYIPMHWNDPTPYFEPGSEIYIVDFSLSRDELLRLHGEGQKLQVLDHHITMQNQLADLPFAHFDMNKSGARLSWEYFHPNTPPPLLILAVEDKDLWQWKLPETRAVCALIDSERMSFESFSALHKLLEGPEREKTLFKGETLSDYQLKMAKAGAKQAFITNIGGYQVRCVNAVNVISDTCDQIIKRYSEIPFAAAFFYKDKQSIVFSLRSRGTFDVEKIALKYGGGGHKNAAGFTVQVGVIEVP